MKDKFPAGSSTIGLLEGIPRLFMVKNVSNDILSKYHATDSGTKQRTNLLLNKAPISFRTNVKNLTSLGLD